MSIIHVKVLHQHCISLKRQPRYKKTKKIYNSTVRNMMVEFLRMYHHSRVLCELMVAKSHVEIHK